MVLLDMRCIKFVVLAYFRQTLGGAATARMTSAAMAYSIQFILSALLLATVQASLQDNGPQTLEAPQYAQKYKEVIMYLTPTQIKNYEAGHGLPNLPQASLSYEQQSKEQEEAQSAYRAEKVQQTIRPPANEHVKYSQPDPTYIFEQQKPQPETPINDLEGQIIQSTLDILEANKMQFQNVQQNNPNVEITKAEVDQSSDIRPIVEPNTEKEKVNQPFQLSLQQQQEQQHQQQLQQQHQQQLQHQHQLQQQYQQQLQHQQQEQRVQDLLIEQARKEQEEQVAKSYAFIHFFSNQKPESPQKIQIFHPEPHAVSLDDDIRSQKENNIEIQRDPLLRQKYKLIPYEYIAEQNIHEKIKAELFKQGENKVQQQLFLPAPEQLQLIKESQNQPKQYQQQYAPQYSVNTDNIELGKILQEIQLEREAAKIHAENIAKSPPVVIHRDISIIKRRPVHVTKHINVPYPAPFLVPFTKKIEVKVPQPYAVPIEIVRHVPVPVVKTETVEVEKPVPYEVEKHVPEIVEKKVYIPVEKPYTVERIVPVEVKKEIPVEIPIHKPEKFTIIRHVWKH